jgi:multiple sugar transport system ATP-binding protein
MTVYENLAFPLKMRKYPKQEIHSRVKKVAELLNIAHLLNRKPSQLSGGEMQRVAVGRAIIREPKVFLMDEPLSNLDAKLRVYMRVELKKLQKEVGVTTIYVTHDQAEAMTMGDRIAVMNKGEIQQVNTPENVYFKPANVFVASFIGSPAANLIACTLAETEGKNYLDAGIFKINISEEASKLIKNNAISPELVIGVRPEDISILREKHSVNAIQAEVYAMEPLGKEVIVDLKVGDDLLKSISSYLECSDLKIGDKVWLMFDETKIHIFDKKTGKIIY